MNYCSGVNITLLLMLKNWLTVTKQEMVQILRCELEHIVKIGSRETHVVSRQVLIAYVINRLIIVSVLCISSSQIIAFLSMKNIPFDSSPALV